MPTPGAQEGAQGLALKIPDGAASGVDLRPELSTQPSIGEARPYTSLDLVVTISAVKLHLYDAFATTPANVKEHGIARFALNDNTLRLKTLSDGALEAQVVLRSMTMNNTRSGSSKFREIMPGAQHDRNQVMLLYTLSSGQESHSLAILTIDSPEVIFAVDPVITLLDFFTSAFITKTDDGGARDQDVAGPETQTMATSSSIDFRVDLHDVSVCILEDDTNPESQAIRLTVKQLLISQQVSSEADINEHESLCYAGCLRCEREPCWDVPHANGKADRKRSLSR